MLPMRVLRFLGLVASIAAAGCANQLASIAPSTRDFSVASSRQMCRVARQAVASAGLSLRFRIRPGYVETLNWKLDADAVHATSILSELCCATLGAFFAHLRRDLPDRDCWVLDYQGTLHRAAKWAQDRTALLQDLAQVASGQDIPSSSAEWRAAYRRAGVRLREAHTFDTDKLTWFVYRLRL